MSDPLPVLIVDDQAPFRAAMKAVLQRSAEFELVGEAASGTEAVSLERGAQSRPRPDGHQHARDERDRGDPSIVRDHPDVVVILCSTYDAGDLPPEAATSGARAYLNKEHLGADTLRRLWEERDAERVRLRLSRRPSARSQGHGTA